MQFAACIALVALAGPLLCRGADAIADKTGLSGNWIGLILVATVTSLPELATGVSAITLAGEPDIAVGDVLGSCVFNPAILAALDFMQRGEGIYRQVGMGHVVSAAFGVVAAGLWLPFVAVDLAEAMGWRTSFVGTMFVAAMTSVPELAVTVAAVRLGAIDMAMANLLGSNLFNMVMACPVKNGPP